MNIFVAKLNYDTQDDTLLAAFEEFGSVDSAKIIYDKFTDRSKGFGFVEMPDETASKRAIAELDGATVENRTIKVNEARPKESRPARNDYGRNFNNANSYNKNRY